MNIAQITSLEELAAFTGIVIMSAPWCGPCKRYKPELARVAEEQGVELREVDLSAHGDIATHFGVRQVPMTLFFRDGVEHTRMLGAQGGGAIEQALGDTRE